jgi:DNA adenine methylase
MMLDRTSIRDTYVEPFLGGGSVAQYMAPNFESALLGDANPDLILLWQALQGGWTPPEDISEGEYRDLRDAPPSPLRAFVGFGCSFGGKWFDGYARNGRDNYAAMAARSLTRKMRGLHDATFRCGDYREIVGASPSVIYLDPPYAGTTGYAAVGGEFDSQALWVAAATWATRGHEVFVSEYDSPLVDAEIVWEKKVALHLSGGSQRDARVERLYHLRTSVQL